MTHQEYDKKIQEIKEKNREIAKKYYETFDSALVYQIWANVAELLKTINEKNILNNF